MNIREMTETDYDQVYQLWLACAGMGLNDLDDSKEGIARFLQRNPQTCLVAVENQIIIGAILVGFDGRRAYIYHTAVHPNYRRRGIARQLVETVLTVLDELKIHKVAFGRIQKECRRKQVLGEIRILCSRRSHLPQSTKD